MATLHKILFGSALVALAGMTQAQTSVSGSTNTTGPAAGVASPVPVDNSSGASATGTGASGTGASGTGATGGVTSTPSASTSDDPYVQRREARKQAKTDYKDEKKSAKQEYKEEKHEADAALKASHNEPGVQHNVDGMSNSGH